MLIIRFLRWPKWSSSWPAVQRSFCLENPNFFLSPQVFSISFPFVTIFLFQHKICPIIYYVLLYRIPISKNFSKMRSSHAFVLWSRWDIYLSTKYIWITKLPRGFYSSVFGYRFCLRANITFNSGEFKVKTVTCHLMLQHYESKFMTLG